MPTESSSWQHETFEKKLQRNVDAQLWHCVYKGSINASVVHGPFSNKRNKYKLLLKSIKLIIKIHDNWGNVSDWWNFNSKQILLGFPLEAQWHGPRSVTRCLSLDFDFCLFNIVRLRFWSLISAFLGHASMYSHISLVVYIFSVSLALSLFTQSRLSVCSPISLVRLLCRRVSRVSRVYICVLVFLVMISLILQLCVPSVCVSHFRFLMCCLVYALRNSARKLHWRLVLPVSLESLDQFLPASHSNIWQYMTQQCFIKRKMNMIIALT